MIHSQDSVCHSCGLTLTWTNKNIENLIRKLGNRRIGGEILYYPTLGSTMDQAALLAQEGYPDGAVILAEEQTASRGRFNRHWITVPGHNVSFSVVLRTDLSILRQVNIAATLGLADAIENIAGVEATIKWPNDVRVGGKKIAGILIESSMVGSELDYAILGIGINVNFDPYCFPEISTTATSFYNETGRQFDRSLVLQSVLERLDDRYSEVVHGKSLRDQWVAKLDTLGQVVRVAWRDEEVVGLAKAVDDNGNLVLVQNDGSTITVIAGEVTLKL